MDPVATRDGLISSIKDAFSNVEYPGDWCLRGSNEGDEPYLTEAEFKGKSRWQDLDPHFLDQAPDGYATALSFFSDEAFRFFLPAYLIASIERKLIRVDPALHLWYGLSNQTKSEFVNTRRYGNRTWFESKAHKFAVFDATQAQAIIDYLRFIKVGSSREKPIEEALANYWLVRDTMYGLGRKKKVKRNQKRQH